MKALNERVTVADMANTPLQSGSVSMVVFCLSLMGTNITQFIQEAHRVLAAEGVLWISEVSSRFNRDMKTFSDGVESIGFKCTSCNTDMTHFATLTLKRLNQRPLLVNRERVK
ncbi:RRP8 [Bugula neritina]|uniref:Ribosomal RNA-processing protein 8 n=1 Tax=Bugula neritina TaxID=10212 RepID=A0A7J7JNZ5_BUGNE|nr:RRP8 [Bugula neritina]